MKQFLQNYKIGKIPVHFIIIGILGLVLLVLGNPMENNSEELTEEVEKIKPQEKQEREILYESEESLYKKEIEENLSNILTNVKGTGEVCVMLQLKGGHKLEVAKDHESDMTVTTETDIEGGERVIKEKFKEEELIMTRDNGDDKPLVLRELKPKINGVLIVAGGGESARTKKELMDAVQSLLDVPSHKIKVLPRE